MEEILLEEEREEDSLRDFYIRNLPHLTNFPVYEIPTKVLRHMAIILHRTSSEDYWKEYIEEMGISNHLVISEIETHAPLFKQLPFYFALRGPLSESVYLEQIIRVFLSKGRLDILAHIQPFIRSILRKIALPFPENDRSYLETNCVYCDCCKIEVHHNEFNTRLEKTGLCVSVQCGLQHKDETPESNMHRSMKNNNAVSEIACESSDIQGSSKENNITHLEKQISYISNTSKNPTVSNAEKQKASCISNNCENKTVSCTGKQILTVSGDRSPSPSAPPIDTVSVFILHTEMDIGEAQRLSNIFQEEGLIVRLLSDVDYLLMIDAFEALGAIFLEVDFIVPIVSVTFLEQIRPQQQAQGSAMHIRYIYQLMQNEYQMNWCLNFRVR
ncbi:hypothetical protein X975_19387, partial [Stegodyphus mimosarum]